ncbi:hypothetical protein JNB_12244 [Janibacter sp. HTCC2649]|uniref:hypothetical protein n=1 Tax=Janibacter sp. HTCC2649 TaxID=313589 RepID=UPI0000670ADD|nr:hypothetical protein [Janibacter sp. HTCC2649]EAQ00946.1 hypothetical protein JNB_12244 [Janibacter sp. HTCC2649]
MSEGYVIDAFGARWSLDTDALGPVDAVRLRLLWERCRIPDAGAGDVGVEPFVVTDSDPYAVSRAITLASLQRQRGSAVLLHAAGLSRGERAIALVGRSGAGKSTAARVLGQHFGYLTDETVAIEGDGRVAPYPKPISIITDPDAPWDKGEWSPDELGLRKASEPAYLTGLVVLERDPERTAPELVELPIIDALLAVIAQSSSLPALDRPLHRLAEALSGSGGPYLLHYSEIDGCIDLIGALLAGDKDSKRDPWTSTPPDPDPTVQGGEFGTDTPIVRAPWRDAVHGEGGTLILVDETPVRLGPIGEILWGIAAVPVSRDDAYAAVVAELGPHPDAARAVDDGIAQLVDLGLLRTT